MAPPMVLGLQMSTVCNFEFSIYFGHQPCPVTPEVIGSGGGLLESSTCWLVQAVPAQTLWTNGNCVDLGFNSFSLAKVAFWPELSHDFLLNEKVRATSFVLLLGVGSFVCYRIFHHLRGQLGKRKYPTNNSNKKSSRKRGLDEFCANFSDDSSELSSISDLSVSNTSCCERESSSESFSFSDGNDNLKMGLTSSNIYEPVQYTKNNGAVSFGKSIPGQPRDILNKDVARLRTPRKRQLLSSGDWTAGVLRDDKENDFETSGSMMESDPFLDSSEDAGLNSFQSQLDSMSLKGNFSPGSLRERMMKTEEFLLGNQDSLSSNSRNRLRSASRTLKREFSTDSFSFGADSRTDWSTSRTLSIDSQVSELAPEYQQDAREIGCVAVERIENLETELNDLKQTVIDLDSEFVNLKYKKPPERCWELTNISLSEEQSPNLNGEGLKDSETSKSSRVLDVIERHKNKMWYKGLLDNKRVGLKELENLSQKAEEGMEIRWDLVSQRLLDWDVEEEENVVDSGSDFGNSLETDSVEFEESCAPASLEWDIENVSEVDNEAPISLRNNNVKIFNNKTSSESGSSDPMKKKNNRGRKSLTRKNNSSENSARSRPKSDSSASNLLAEQIIKAIKVANVDFSPMSNPASISSMLYSSLREEDQVFRENEIDEARNVAQLDDNGNEDYTRRSPTRKNEFRDSAYYDGSDFPDAASSMDYFEEPLSLSSLVASADCSEWMAKGLDVVAKNLEIKLAQKVRNDHYCQIRACVFHLLSKGHSLLGNRDSESNYRILTSVAQGSAPWLLRWSFGSKLPYAGESCLKGFWECLKSLEEMEKSLKTLRDKENFLLNALKDSDDLDAKLNEAVKLLMVVSSLKLYDILGENNFLDNGDNGDVRMFSMLLYGRESCRTPRELVMDNLDKIGNALSLDQIGLNLLGISLSATIKVIRPHQFNTQEFIQACPDWKSNVWPEVLLATDDKNVWLLKR